MSKYRAIRPGDEIEFQGETYNVVDSIFMPTTNRAEIYVHPKSNPEDEFTFVIKFRESEAGI